MKSHLAADLDIAATYGPNKLYMHVVYPGCYIDYGTVQRKAFAVVSNGFWNSVR